MDSAGPFGVDAQTGSIKVINAGTWDFESSLPIRVSVKVTDSFVAPATSTRTITLSPSDVNEPQTGNAAEFSIEENARIGTVVGSVIASDPDAGLAGKLLYSIGASGPADVFSIDATNTNDPPTNISFSSVAKIAETAIVSTPVFVANIQVVDDVLGTNSLGLSGSDSSFFSIVNRQLFFRSDQQKIDMN